MIAALVSFGSVLLAALLAFLGWIARKVLGIEAQLQNNGGASLRDAVDRVEDALTAHLIVAAGDQARFDEHLRKH